MSKFWEIYRFELVYQLSRPVTWILFVAFLGLTFMLEMSFVDNALEGEAYMNSPLILSAITAFSNIFGLLLIAALAGDAAIRDLQERMDPLVYTTSLGKCAYLGGRMLGAFTIASLMMLLVVPLGMMLTTFMPEITAALYGPFSFRGYLDAFIYFTLPNAFVATAIVYALVLLSRQYMAGFVGAVILFLCSMFSMDLMAGHLNMWELAKLLDTSGLTIVKEFRKAWTPQQLHSQLLIITSSLLINRLIWVGIASGMLLMAFSKFRFAHYVGGNIFSRLWKRTVRPHQDAPAPMEGQLLGALPVIPRPFDINTRLEQALFLTKSYLLEIASSWGALALIALVYVFTQMVPELLEGSLGVPLTPTTGNLATIFNHMLIKSFVVMLIILYAGQLVWRERDARINDLADAAPVPDQVIFISKLITLALVILVVQAVIILTGMGIQASLDYYQFEIGLYLQIFFGIQLVDYLLIGITAMAVHVLVNQKYVGHMLLIVLYAYAAIPEEFGIEHKLLIWGSDTGWSYSDMQGFNPSLTPWLWFKFYWIGWGLLFGFAAKLFWMRGKEVALHQRFSLAQQRITPALLIGVAATLMLIVATGAFIFYNTNILNEYRTASKAEARRAQYEQLYGKFIGVPQPQLTATRLKVEIYPETQGLNVQGSYTLVNRTAGAIDTIHLATTSEVTTTGIKFSRKAKSVLTEERLGHRIYVLEQALAAGDTLQLNFSLDYQPKGFTNNGIATIVSSNGTYFRSQEWLPEIGYQPGRELSNPAERKHFGLAKRPAIHAATNKEALLNTAGREHIQLDVTVGTSADQLAVAPGSLRRSWTEDGRRYAHYVTDGSIRNGYAILSAKFKVYKKEWRGIKLQIYHHPGHTNHPERIMHSLQASMEYHTRHFGPYPHRELKMVQYAGKGSLTSFPGLITYPENFALMQPDKDWRNFDFQYAVVAHEVAHQWWGNQLVPAYVEGAALISESLAWYSAMGVVQQAHGTAHRRRLVEVMQDSYLTPRSRADVPLLRATDHFQAYRKGPFAMHALREYIGEEQVNLALKRLLNQYGGGEAPLPTSLNFFQELQAVTPDSLAYLLSDLFETNTFWELKTQKVWAEPLQGGGWQVTLDVLARKHDVDSAGIEKEVAMNDLVEIGIYANTDENLSDKPLYLSKHRLQSGMQRITLTVPTEPARAGIDPRSLLIDTKMSDNVGEVINGKVPKQLSTLGRAPAGD